MKSLFLILTLIFSINLEAQVQSTDDSDEPNNVEDSTESDDQVQSEDPVNDVANLDDLLNSQFGNLADLNEDPISNNQVQSDDSVISTNEESDLLEDMRAHYANQSNRDLGIEFAFKMAVLNGIDYSRMYGEAIGRNNLNRLWQKRAITIPSSALLLYLLYRSYPVQNGIVNLLTPTQFMEINQLGKSAEELVQTRERISQIQREIGETQLKDMDIRMRQNLGEGDYNKIRTKVGDVASSAEELVGQEVAEEANEKIQVKKPADVVSSAEELVGQEVAEEANEKIQVKKPADVAEEVVPEAKEIKSHQSELKKQLRTEQSKFNGIQRQLRTQLNLHSHLPNSTTRRVMYRLGRIANGVGKYVVVPIATLTAAALFIGDSTAFFVFDSEEDMDSAYDRMCTEVALIADALISGGRLYTGSEVLDCTLFLSISASASAENSFSF